MDIGDILVGTQILNPSRVGLLSQALATKWGITTVGSQEKGPEYTDTTDSASINVRYYIPDAETAAAPLVIYCHPFTQNEQIQHGTAAYPFAAAAVQEGWMFAGSRMHGDNWGDDDAQTDLANLYTLVSGIRAVSGVILVGASMGGLAACLAVARTTLGAGVVKGVALVDAVTNLVWAYTGNANAYQTAINTAYGISTVGQIPPGNDPNQLSPSVFGSTPFRFYASTTDTSVVKTQNTDLLRAAISGQATESDLVTHNTSGHLNAGAFPPADFIAFSKRCLGLT
jgi:pimeloyl-ACP methyl ester carboxylesterase